MNAPFPQAEEAMEDVFVEIRGDQAMEEQTWEFCVLSMNSAKEVSTYKKALGGIVGVETGKGWAYDCSIWYCGPTGQVIAKQLSNFSEVSPVNPFDKAMGLLGGGGWELVSVQNATPLGGGGGQISGTGRIEIGGGLISFWNIVAYFKRPVRHGRRVDEPELVI